MARKPSGGLTKWVKEKWVDISRPKKGGGYMPCGRSASKKGKYPKPYKIGINTTVWRSDEIQALVDDLCRNKVD